MSEKEKEMEEVEVEEGEEVEVDDEVQVEEEVEEIEEEAEEEILEHWSHEHPLTLVETHTRDDCYGCGLQFSSGEQAYVCSSKKCWYAKVLHQECAEMARKIRHPLHPQHILIQQHQPYPHRCEVCKRYIYGIYYTCTSSECKFKMHMRCAQVGGVMDAADDDDDERRRSVIHHPSHPGHELRLFGRCSFKCDACGTTRRGNSHICTACRYWIHQQCASLPQTIEREDHHHSLSLSFHVPLEYMKYNYKCDVCNKYFLPKYWIYHCQLCSFAVHIKCAFNKSSHTPTNDANASNGRDTIHLPTNDVGEELIRPFVMRAIPLSIIPHDDDDEMMNVKYEFVHHKHQLTLISSSSSSSSQNQEEEDDDYGKRSELICDGCITPILSSPSSSSSSSRKYYYMSCSECKYNLHNACFHLPPHLPSLPLHPEPLHDLLLQSCDTLKPWDCQVCNICYYPTNGLFYACKKCDFKADVKCASLPDTIHHAAQPHLLKHVTGKDMQRGSYSTRLSCAALCQDPASWFDCYTSGDFMVHVRCAVLPASTTSRGWDKRHLQLPLTYDANLNHPGEFYCDECEKEMNPKMWMYHCRRCDISFHPWCFPTTSGYYRNIKFGKQYVIARSHPHTLTYQLLTTKRRCDSCRRDSYKSVGFHCASCNFFVCLGGCRAKITIIGYIRAVD